MGFDSFGHYETPADWLFPDGGGFSLPQLGQKLRQDVQARGLDVNFLFSLDMNCVEAKQNMMSPLELISVRSG